MDLENIEVKHDSALKYIRMYHKSILQEAKLSYSISRD